ncbi:DUF1592 domain-containing protein [Alienimonas sp. DA493]|uniref:DUF1592 domain-containing protein n=1 Tax=Alienimonas sp. DA493 TaxID=3373605 RepID=UPI00375401AF
MTRVSPLLAGCAALLCPVFAVPAGAADDFADRILPLLEDNCTYCHGAADEDPAGGFAMAGFADRASVLRERATWAKALEAIETHAMPPADDAWLDPADRHALAAWLRGALAEPEPGLGRARVGAAPLRRLTRLEYNNTVRDLLGLETDVFMFPERLPFDKAYFDPAADRLPAELSIRAREYGAKYPVLLPTAGLPGDGRAEHGFSNRGDAQDMSDSLLEQYLSLADAVASHPELFGRAARLRDLAPEVADAAPKPSPGPNRPRNRLVAVASAEFAPNDNLARTAEGSAVTLEAFRQQVAAAHAEGRGGTFDADAVANTTVPGKGGVLHLAPAEIGGRTVGLNPSEDLWSAVFSTGRATSGNAIFTNRQKDKKNFLIGFEGEDRGAVRAVGVSLVSRRGQSGAITLTAECTGDEAVSVTVELAAGAGADNVFAALAAPDGEHVRRLVIDGSAFSGDYVLLDDLALLCDSPPPAPALVGVEPAEPEDEETPKPAGPAPDADLGGAPRDRVTRFLRRAFRRPVDAAEADRYFALYQAGQAEGGEERAARQVVRAALSSPSFLYVNPTPPEAADASGVRPLTDHELANRLSYFLWSTLPDDELFALADAGRLSDPDVLEAQARRMIRDPRVRELSENFFVEWLRLRELWSAQPDRRAFRAFYAGAKGKNTLADDMFAEALLLFERILIEDRSVLELIDADAAYLNGPLAELYGLEGGPDGDRTWRRVDLPDGRRGGLLTTGAVLTLTSFPHRTSPIRRGAWTLETILNRPPAPPNAAVTDVDEQAFGDALTLRQKVERHREDPACAICHDRIDLPGFVLENYDAIGRWRETDDAGGPIEPAGDLPGVGAFGDVTEFKRRLCEDRLRFARGVTERLLSYALARELAYHDLAPVERILAAADGSAFRLSDLVAGVVRSDPFRHADRPADTQNASVEKTR